MKNFKKILSLITNLGFATLAISSSVACENKKSENYNYQLLLTMENKVAYRLKFDNNNDWYIASNSKLVIGKDKNIIKTIDIKDLILTIFINQINNDWYVGTVNGHIFTGNIANDNIIKLFNGWGTEVYSVYCDANDNWYAGFSSGDIFTGNKESGKFNHLTDVRDYVLSIENYNNKILFGLGNGKILSYQTTDKSWTTLNTFQDEEIYNIINKNQILYVLTNKKNFYQLKNNTWTNEAHIPLNIIFNMTISQKGEIYNGDDKGNVYNITNNKVTKIANINNINIIDIKENQSILYIISVHGDLYKMNV